MKPAKPKNTNRALWNQSKEPERARAMATKKEKPDELTTGNKPIADFPLLQRDAQNNVTGVDLPNGDSFRNLDPETVQKLVDDWNNQNAEPANSMYADVWQKKQEELAAAEAAKGPPVTEEQLAQVGKIGDINDINSPTREAYRNDPTTQDILKKQQQREDVLQSPAGAKSLQVGSGLVTKIPVVGTFLLQELNKNKAIREFLQDYSQEDNFQKVKNRVAAAKTELNRAIYNARKPGNSQDAIDSYQMALTSLAVSEQQLKQISMGDQRAYVEKINIELTDLENFRRAGIPDMNIKMRQALLNPDPKWYDNQAQELMGGGTNG